MNLQQKLRAGHFVLTAEVTPPVSFSRGEFEDKALPLKGLADAVNVTDGAGARAHLGATTAAAMLVEKGVEPILQLTCRDRNRIALQSELISAAASGVRNLLMLRGDNPDAGDQPDAKPVFDLDPRSLLETARRLRDEGELPTGRKVGGKAEFFLGAADMPIDPPAAWKPDSLKAKFESGAQFAQTQFCMDVGVLARYGARLAEHDIPEKLPILVGVAPLRSARSARWIKERLFGAIVPNALIERMERSADPAAEGVEICLELIEQIAAIPHVAGVHIMAPGNDAVVPGIIAQAKKRISRTVTA